MSHVLVIAVLAAAFGLVTLLSRASEPSMVLVERAKTTAAEATVTALQTRVASFPTPTRAPCRGAPYFTPC